MVLDAIDEIDADPEGSERYRHHLLSGAASAGIAIPHELPDPEATAIYTSLTIEMQYAKSTGNASYAATVFHLKRSDAEHLGFNTRVEPGHFTDMV
jgi:hypothetical protein